MYLKFSDQKIQLAADSFAEGGEGGLFRVLSPVSKKDYAAKIYHPTKRTQKRESKLLYLCKHKPVVDDGQTHIIWPEDLIYDEQGNFIGLLMPFIEGEKLEGFCLPKLPRKLRTKEWNRFGLSPENWHEAILFRLKLCFNLAIAVSNLHRTNRYILVDLKPDNVMVQPNGAVFLVDGDSIEVVEDGKTLFEAPVATPEYTPPEFYKKATLSIDPTAQKEWDIFSLAVILYKLLLGLHPFAASCKPPYSNLVSLHEKVQHGFYVHMPGRSKVLKVIPQPHRLFRYLPIPLQMLFNRCFNAGHENAAHRPPIEEWLSVLRQSIAFWTKNPVDYPKITPPKKKSKDPARWFDDINNLRDKVKIPKSYEVKKMDWKKAAWDHLVLTGRTNWAITHNFLAPMPSPSNFNPAGVVLAVLVCITGVIISDMGGIQYFYVTVILTIIAIFTIVFGLSMSYQSASSKKIPTTLQKMLENLVRVYLPYFEKSRFDANKLLSPRIVLNFQHYNYLRYNKFKKAIAKIDRKYKAVLKHYKVSATPQRLSMLQAMEKEANALVKDFEKGYPEAFVKAAQKTGTNQYGAACSYVMAEHKIKACDKLIQQQRQVKAKNKNMDASNSYFGYLVNSYKDLLR